MNGPDAEQDLSDNAWERLRREQGYLSAARTLFKHDGDNELVQLLFAEQQDAGDCIGVIRQFVALIDLGITPPPNILVPVAAGFRAYLNAAGKMSLDESFRLKPKQRVGHPLMHRTEKEKKAQAAYVMWCLRREATLRGDRLSIEDAASEAINRFDLPYQEDVLKKNYIELNAEEVFSQAAEAIDDFRSGNK